MRALKLRANFFFVSYIIPGVVLGVAVGSGRGLVVSLALDSCLEIVNKNPGERLFKNHHLQSKNKNGTVYMWQSCAGLQRLTCAPCHSAAGWWTPG